LKEERTSDSRQTIFANVFGDICGIHTKGLLNLSFSEMEGFLQTAI